MASGQQAVASPSSSADHSDDMVSELKEKHRLDLEKLTLTTQPFRTLQLFILATEQYLRQTLPYALKKGGWLMVPCIMLVALGFVLVTVDGSHGKHVQGFLNYFTFGLWWIALGIASSIGLGSGLHTFVLYLGPHIAFFTIKAVQCGRVDLKSATYDTIQLKRGPSWLEKDCSEFGPPLFLSSSDSLVRVPLSIILPQVQMETILWGIGTALGEVPPYFISKAARLSGKKVDAMEELDATSSTDDGFISGFLKKIKRWLLTHAQHLNFFTILVLSSVPNPLFDLAGILCGQFGISFWKFFPATLIGKAFIKSHIQTSFVISICNNQLLELVEKKLIWMLGLIPGLSSILPNVITKLHMAKDKYQSSAQSSLPSNKREKQWNLSFNLIWNSVVWLVLLNFFAKLVTAAAQSYLKEQQHLELINLSSSRNSKKSDDVPTNM